MATDLQQKSTSPKFESYVEEQLGKVRGRIRALDIGASALLLLAATLGYALAMALFDLAVAGAEGSWYTPVRYAAFGLFIILTLTLLWQIGLKCYRRINPYFAARQLEETLPDAKNSVINWLDLRAEPLAPAIRNAVGLRAARDLRQADPEKAVPTKTNWLLGGILTGLVVGLLIVFAMSPGRFMSLLSRAFVPFRGAPLVARTSITLMQPAEGNATVGLNQKVDIRALIEGAFPRASHPDAPTLHLRYQPGDPFVTRPLEQDGDGPWSITILPDQVQSGFWYKLSAGDGETPEYQVQVRSQPRVTKFEVTYHYRAYRKLLDEVVTYPNQHAVHPRILGHRGTDIDLLIRTNRPIKEGRVELTIDGQKSDAKTEPHANDPHVLRAKFTLEKSGQFRVLFTAADGEENSDRSPYLLEVLEDGKPTVVLTQPGQDVSLPANGTLPLEGKAIDDFGVKSMTLRMQVVEGGDKPALAAKPYRPGKSFAFDNGTYPPWIEYQDMLALDKLQTDQGKPFTPKAGSVLEYWLEAVDNADFPSKDGNLGKSQAFKVTILDPNPDQKKNQAERKQADQQQKQHEKNQDAKHAKDNKQRNQEGNGNTPEDQQKKEDLEKNIKDKADKLQDQLNKEKGESKGQENGQEQPKAENKPGPDDKAQQPGQEKNEKPANADQAGAKKEDGPKKEGDNPQAKGQGEQDKTGKQPPPSEAKGGNGPDKNQSQAKDNDPKTDPKDGPNPKAKEGGGKNQPDQAKQKGGGSQAKPDPAQAKNKSGQEEEPKQAEAKGGGEKTGEKAEAKEGQGAGNPKEAPQAAAKNGGGDKGPRTDAKNTDPKQANDSGLAKNDQPQKGDNTQAREPTLDELAKLKELLKRQDQAEEVAEELARLAKEAKDDKVREAAKEALEKAGRDPENPKNRAKGAEAGKDEKAEVKNDGQGMGDGNNPAEAKKGDSKDGSPGKGKGDVKDPKFDEKQSKSDNKAGNFGPGGQGIEDANTKMNPTDEFLKRPGNLQLQKLMDRMTPDIIKKAGLTDKDWQQFLKDASEYDDLLRKEQLAAKKTPNDAKGKTSKLESTGIRPIGSQPNAQVDPVQSGRALPPPEFRESQGQFTKRQPKQ